MTDHNPRATIGDNVGEIDYAKMEVERLTSDYAELLRSIEEMEREADALPERIDDDETKGRCASLVKRLRDAAKRADGFRELEKQPFLRRGQGVDQFFFGVIDRVAKRNKRDRDGVSDTLLARINDFDARVLRAEQERRRKEAEEAARRAAELRRQQEEEERRAREAREAAERARKPENQAAKEAVADQHQAQATETRIEAEIAEERAEDAYVETLARPAEIMRRRGDDGTLSTMKREGYAEIVDETMLDKNALWPFIALDAKEKALRAWAKAQGHRVEMAGAAVGFRNKSVVR